MAVGIGKQYMCFINSEGVLYESGKITASESVSRPQKIDTGNVCFDMVSVGGGHRVALGCDGGVYTWGVSTYGCLGLSGDDVVPRPTLIQSDLFGNKRTVMVACGRHFTLVLTEEGRIWSFGCGVEGHLGHGDLKDRLYPTEIDSEKVTMIAAGTGHSMATTENGRVYTWGYGDKGRLGHGVDLHSKLSPTMIEKEWFGKKSVFLVSGGYCHSAAVTTDGTLYTWGNNDPGYFKNSNNITYRPRRMSSKDEFDGSTVVMVSCGACYTLVLTALNNLWSWGNGEDNVLGHNSTDNEEIPRQIKNDYFKGEKIVTCTGGLHLSTALTENGNLYAWGSELRVDLYEMKNPTMIPLDHLDYNCVGRCHKTLSIDKKIALAMGLHKTLGSSSLISCLDDYLLQMCIKECHVWPKGKISDCRGAMAMLGAQP